MSDCTRTETGAEPVQASPPRARQRRLARMSKAAENLRRGPGLARFTGVALTCLLAGVCLLLVCAAAQADQPAGLFAQGFDALQGRAAAGSGSGLIDVGWPVKVLLLFVAFLAALLFCFLVVFPSLLRKSKPWWPLSAYGFCLSLLLTCTFLAALLLFWDSLVMGGPGPKSWFQVWGGRILLTFIWLLVASVILSVCRSPRAREAASALKNPRK
jgi:hypothetical protein